MTKAEFIATFKEALPDIFPTKTAAEKAYVTFCKILAKAATSGANTRLPGIGTFSIIQRAPRTGRNPRTGTPIRIPARKAIRFSPSRTLSQNVEKKFR